MRFLIFSLILFIVFSIVFVKAIKGDFNEILVEKKFEYSPKILFTIAYFQQIFFSYEKAIDTYRLIVEKFPESKYADDSLYRMASIFYDDLNDRNKAIEALKKLVYFYPESEYRDESERKIEIYIKGPEW